MFLIDEFGTGSDPELGGALAETFLEVFYEREKKSYEQLSKNKNMNLKNIDFNKIPSLSKEILEKLNKLKPENLYDAGKISGITPSALFQIIKHKKVKGVKAV